MNEQLLDYEFNTQFYERRIQTLIDSCWEDFAKTGQVTMRNYIIAVSFEG